MNIKEALESAEGKAAIQSAVEDAVKGLQAKNEELLDKLKKEKAEKKAAQDAIDAAKAEADEAAAKAAEKSGDVDKIRQSLEAKHKKEKDELLGKLSAKDTQLHSVLIDGGLTDALIKANIAPQHLAAVKALIKTTTKAEISEADGKPVATIDGKPINDYVTGWSQGDQGKHYVAAPQNGGGGANGSNGNGKAVTGKTMPRADFDRLSPVEQSARSREGITLTD